MVNGPRDTQFVKRAILLAGLVLVIVYFNQVLKAAKSVYDIVLPLVLGFIIAYVVNILMRFLERHYFPKAEKPWIARTRRPVCLLLSYVLILLILAAVIT